MSLRRKPYPLLFKWRHFEPEIILLCIRWYLSYRLSYRDLVEIMDERGLKISHTTILRWVFRFSNVLKNKVRPHLRKNLTSWRLDETYIKVKGKWTYLYRAVDRDGKTIDFYLSRKRDSKAAHSFFKKIIRLNSPQTPYVINVDKNPAYTHAKQKLERENKWPKQCKLRQNKYMNNIIEQDHRTVKWKMNHAMGYHTMWHATTTITGVETMHMLRKGQ
ncbi:IS6 family transposase, partial [bacterium]|nr:IS6 family transposase [bacterium]